MKKLEKRDRCLEMQGDIITQERDKNLALEASMAKEKMKVEKLTIELSLTNDSIEKLTKEHSLVNDQVASLKNEKSIAQESLTSLEEKYQNLEVNYSTLLASTSTSVDAKVDLQTQRANTRIDIQSVPVDLTC